MGFNNLPSVKQPIQYNVGRHRDHWVCPSAAIVLSHAQQCTGGGYTGGTLVDAVVIVRNSWHKLCPRSVAAPEGFGQFWAEGQGQPLDDELELPAETSVYPEVEDAVEETIGGRQPHHHKLNPLWYAAAWDCCGKNTCHW